MVSAELIHNPYLLLTTVKFNGQAPRINSQIEKYEDKPLKDWVQMIPNIFYNEMNGYDFDLYFTGTNSDFKEIKQIFESVGVSSEQVRLIHKNELEDVETKSAEIDALLSWLRMHPNRKFDYYNFLEKYAEVFEGSYPCIFIRGIIADEMPDFVSPEVVSSVKELEHTNLTNIPIIFYVEDATSIEFRKDLHMLLNRLDIRKEQIFFLTHAMLDNNQVSRTISDLGVEVPQVIETCNDVSVITYFKHYPITEYVRSAIHVFSSLTNQIGIILEEEHKKSEIINTEIHKELDLLEIELLSLKHANNFFVQRDNYVAPQVFQEYRQTLLEQIQKWKNKKIKIVGDSEIEMAATDYIVTLQKNMRSFFVAMSTTYKKEGESINNHFSTAYIQAGIDKAFRPDGIVLTECLTIYFPEMKSELLTLKRITYEDVKNDFFGLLRKQSEGNSELVQVAVCYLEQWRDKAEELLMPLVDNFIFECKSALEHYSVNLAEAYHRHLEDLIKGKTMEKDKVSTQLSDDERNLQEDCNWLTAFKDQLDTIERG